MLNWDNEAQPIKQSSATLVSMLAGLIVGGLPIALSVIVPSAFVVLVLIGYWLVLAVVGVIFYQKLSKLSLNDIDKK